MKTIAFILAFLIAPIALAQSTPSAKTVFSNYRPSVMESTPAVDEAFRNLETEFRKFNLLNLQFGTQCTQRAETWAYGLEKTKGIRSQKVFVFYTHAFKEYYRKANGKDFEWWFHVAPFVLSKASNGTVEERVIDKAFSDRSLTMKEWTDLFIESKEKCIENVPFANFEGDVSAEGASFNRNAHCYLVRAPMYDMFPSDIDARERGLRPQLEWDLNQVHTAAHALTAASRKSFLKRVGLR
ncbi:MAG: hypothetical protein H7333_10555 [Bdellovibrionales bacterium]|nr:hypothetical protein [Oligoflexia bacterium]